MGPSFVPVGGKTGWESESCYDSLSADISCSLRKSESYSSSICEKYVDNIAKIEKDLVDLRLKADGMSGKEKKQLKEEIKHCEESVEAMKVARKNLARFISSFGEGMKEMQK